MILLAPTAMAAGLLAVAGIAKLRAPVTAQAALRAYRLPSGTFAARGLGALELWVGGSALLAPGRTSFAALAVIYAVLTLAVGARWARGERQAPCGCFGEASSTTHVGHVAVNAACALAAAAAAAAPPPGLVETAAGGPAGAALLIGVGGGVYLLISALALAPDSWRAYGSSVERTHA